MKQFISPVEAAAKVKSGMTVMIGGFLAVGTAKKVVEELLAALDDFDDEKSSELAKTLCGYPFGLKNAKIDTFAKMVAIVDVYDAMTSSRIYRGPMCPFKFVDIFEQEGLQKYDTRFIMTFLENIVNTYMLNRVKLNDGRVGDVVFINRASLANQTIKCVNEFIDLSAEPNLHIEAII